MRFRRPVATPVEQRWAARVVAALYALGAALVLYFRVGPLRRVLGRMEGEGVVLPDWAPWAVNLGSLVLTALLSWRAWKHWPAGPPR